MKYKYYDELLDKIVIIEGQFVDREQVTITIWNEYSERVIKRKVHWDGNAKDLYVRVDNIKIYYDYVTSNME